MLRLAAQRAGLRFKLARHSRPTWEERDRRASRPRRRPGAPGLRASAACASSTAITAGCATSRLAPGLSNAARRSRARASNAGAVLRQLEQRGAARGRTIWTKPKPLTAVRSNGWGRTASIAPPRPGARPCFARSAGRSRSTRRCRAGGSPWPLRPRRRTASSSGGKQAVDVDQGHRRRAGDPQLAAGEADDAGSRFVDQIVPAGSPSSSDGPGNAARLAAEPVLERRQCRRRLVADLRQRPLPRLGARDGARA